MLITCPHCATSYDIAAGKLGADGRSVRCARCQTQWHAKLPVSVLDDSEWTVRDDADTASERLVRPDPFAASEPRPISENLPESVANLPPETASDMVVAPPLAPVLEEEAGEPDPAADTTLVDIESQAARHARIVHPAAGARRIRPPRLGFVAVALLAVLAALIIGRTQVVRLLPQTAPLFSAIGLPVNLRGLVFENLGVSGESEDNVPVLVVTGTIRNITGEAVTVPRLRFALRNPAGLEVYAWTILPASRKLAPHASLPFRSRLASPPADSKDVLVRFFGREDIDPGR